MSEASLRAEVTLEGYEDSILQMVSFEVTEALSTLYALEVTVLTPTLVEPESVLGKKAAVMLTNDTDAPPRSFHGVVFEASLSAVDGDAERFELRFVARPRMARLELGQNARITQDMNVPDAIGLVLEESGVAAEHFEWATTGTYEEHPYITQFEESDYGYAARLLAREGISYLVENDFDEERVIFFDDDTVFQPCEHSDALSFLDTVLAMSDTLTSTSDKVALRDYDFTKPATDLTVGADGEETTGREVYLHPGDFLETSRGDRLARVTLERLQRDRRLFHGESVWHYLAPGRTFACVDHPRAELSAEMVVVRVRHVWAQRGYLNEFSCIPRETPFQAVAQPAGPVVGGTQVAFVTGPSGAELHGSERGQVKVRFPWDRSGITDDTSSTWLRVGQFALPGSMVVPRVGFEVLVDFEMASNDRPLVAGHLYNGEAMPPYELPAGAATSSIQTNTTEGGGGANELRFGDTAGSEELFMNASYDQTTSVENDSKTSINANETVSIGADNSVKVTGSYNLDVKGARSLSVGGNQAVSTSANYGDGTSGSLSVTVGSRKETVGGDLLEQTTGTYDRSVGGLMALTGIKAVNRNIVGSSTTKVGAAWLEIVAGDRNSSVGGSRTETIGALKLVKATTVSVGCGAAYVQNCASESVKAGGSETITAKAAVGMQIGGAFDVEATAINISGEAMVVMKIGGTKIEVLPAKVTIKSGTIKLTGVKKLQSGAAHESS